MQRSVCRSAKNKLKSHLLKLDKGQSKISSVDFTAYLDPPLIVLTPFSNLSNYRYWVPPEENEDDEEEEEEKEDDFQCVVYFWEGE